MSHHSSKKRVLCLMDVVFTVWFISKNHSKIRDQNPSPSKVITLLCKFTTLCVPGTYFVGNWIKLSMALMLANIPLWSFLTKDKITSFCANNCLQKMYLLNVIKRTFVLKQWKDSIIIFHKAVFTKYMLAFDLGKYISKGR